MFDIFIYGLYIPTFFPKTVSVNTFCVNWYLTSEKSETSTTFVSYLVFKTDINNIHQVTPSIEKYKISPSFIHQIKRPPNKMSFWQTFTIVLMDSIRLIVCRPLSSLSWCNDQIINFTTSAFISTCYQKKVITLIVCISFQKTKLSTNMSVFIYDTLLCPRIILSGISSFLWQLR